MTSNLSEQQYDTNIATDVSVEWKQKVDTAIKRLTAVCQIHDVKLNSVKVKELPRVLEFVITPAFMLKTQKKNSMKVELRSLGTVTDSNDYESIIVIMNKYTKNEVNQIINQFGTLPNNDTKRFFGKVAMLETASERLPFCPGMDIYGNPVLLDAVSCGHIGIAGQTQSGKTNTIITSILTLHQLAAGKFDMWIIDPTKIVAEAFKNHVSKYAMYDDALELIQEVQREINVRNDKISVKGYLHFKEIPGAERPTPIIVVVEELHKLLDNELYKKKANEVISIIESTIATGAKTGVYYWLCTQYFNKSGSSSIIHSQLQTRFVHWLNSSEATSVWGNASLANEAVPTLLQGAGDFYLGVSGSSSAKRCHSVYISGTDITEFFSKQSKQKENVVCQSLQSELMQESLEPKLSPKVVELFSQHV